MQIKAYRRRIKDEIHIYYIVYSYSYITQSLKLTALQCLSLS